MRSHLQQTAHSDTNRLTGPIPKMILITYKDDAHPRACRGVRNVRPFY
jgi:hypothetical protein